VGLLYYDIYPRILTQKVWDDHYMKRTNAGWTWGIGTWLEEARRRGKKLAVSEWGVWNRPEVDGDPDNPLFIENMYRFFKANAASIAYENYYNASTRHQLYPSTLYPKARSSYQQLW
jgi:hypothetical protein